MSLKNIVIIGLIKVMKRLIIIFGLLLLIQPVMAYNCGQQCPDGRVICDANWNGAGGGSTDASLVYNYQCQAKHPSIFDPLGVFQSDGSTKVFARMDGASTIEVWKVSDGSAQTLISNTCTQLESSGIYYWDTSNLQTQPTVLTDYVYKMTGNNWVSFGKITLKSKRAANFYGDSAWILALAKTGKTCTIELWDFAGNSIGLTSNAMAEIGTTGIYKWNTSNIITQPTEETFYIYKMTTSTGTDTYTGCFSLKSAELGGGGTGGGTTNTTYTLIGTATPLGARKTTMAAAFVLLSGMFMMMLAKRYEEDEQDVT